MWFAGGLLLGLTIGFVLGGWVGVRAADKAMLGMWR